MPDAARADDARVVVGMGPLAHHVDLHGVVGRVRRASPEPHRSATAQRRQDHAESLHVAPPHAYAHSRTDLTNIEHLSLRCSCSSRCQGTARYPRTTCGSPSSLSSLLLALPASAHAAPVARRRRSRKPSVRYGAAHTVTGTLPDGTTPLAGQEVVLEGRRYPYEGSYRVIARTTTDAEGEFTFRPSWTATTACASPRPPSGRQPGAAGLHAARRSSCPSARCSPASCGSTSATRCPSASS